MKEIKITLNTGEGKNTFETAKITGEIKFLILECKKADIIIESELGYTLYKQLQHEGISVFPLMTEPRNSKGHQMNFTADSFYVNEKLLITVEGAKNTDVTVRIRYV